MKVLLQTYRHSYTLQRCVVVGTRQLEKQTKESARRYVIYCVPLGHMFLLVGCGRGARPYGSIMWRSAICFYWLAVGVGLGHMFLLCGARAYVCIGWLWAWRWAICFYWLAVRVALGYMFVLVGCGPYVSIVRVYVYMGVCVYVYMYVCVYMCVYVCMYVCVCVTICFHRLAPSQGRDLLALHK